MLGAWLFGATLLPGELLVLDLALTGLVLALAAAWWRQRPSARWASPPAPSNTRSGPRDQVKKADESMGPEQPSSPWPGSAAGTGAGTSAAAQERSRPATPPVATARAQAAGTITLQAIERANLP